MHTKIKNVQKTVYTGIWSTLGRDNTGNRCAQTFADTSVCLSFHPPVQRDTEHDLVAAFYDPAEVGPVPAEHCSGVPWGLGSPSVNHSLSLGWRF